MKYFIWRNNQQYGPYSLADLQRYLASGQILPTDMGRTESMQDWVRLDKLVGADAAPAVPVPAASAYAPVAPGQNRPLPSLVPDLHWGLLILLTIVTCGLFGWVWMFIEAAAVRRLDPKSNGLIFYAIGFVLTFGSGVVSAAVHPYGSHAGLGGLLDLAGLVIIIIGHFNIRNSLEYYFTQVEPIGLTLNGVMTFFFGPIYFQYHFNRINRWRRTGVLA